MLLYRSMREDPGDGRPLVVASARGLGVRVGEIPWDEEGNVEPESGGMSVALGGPEHLVEHRRPRSLGGTGPDPVWEIDENQLGEQLVCRPDPDLAGHGFVEPVHPMSLEEYELGLAETRDAWRRWS